MTVELFHLCMYGLVIVGATLVQQLTSIFNVGLMPVFGSREGINFTGMTGRLERAILNCAIAMAVIVPPITTKPVTNLVFNLFNLSVFPVTNALIKSIPTLVNHPPASRRKNF